MHNEQDFYSDTCFYYHTAVESIGESKKIAFNNNNFEGTESLKQQQVWSSGYDDCLTRSRSPVQSWASVFFLCLVEEFH